MGYTLLIFVMTIQHFFLMRAFWDKAGVNDPQGTATFNENNFY